jgi:hypothetical protein
MFDVGQRVKLNALGCSMRCKQMINMTGLIVGEGIDDKWVRVDWDGMPSQNWHELKIHLMEIGVNEAVIEP